MPSVLDASAMLALVRNEPGAAEVLAALGMPGNTCYAHEDIDVAHKDRAACPWCENAALLTGTPWGYLKVPQGDFEKLQATEYSDLLVVIPTLLP